MKQLVYATLATTLGVTIVNAQTGGAAAAQREVVTRYCVGCHNSKAKTGGLALDQVDFSRIGENSELGEKMVRKLRAGMMPPLGVRRPDPATYEVLTAFLENELDRAAAAKPGLCLPACTGSTALNIPMRSGT